MVTFKFKVDEFYVDFHIRLNPVTNFRLTWIHLYEDITIRCKKLYSLALANSILGQIFFFHTISLYVGSIKQITSAIICEKSLTRFDSKQFSALWNTNGS